MAQFSNQFSDIHKLQQNPQAQQLAQLLQNMGGERLQQAMQLASKGQTEQAKQILLTCSKERVKNLKKKEKIMCGEVALKRLQSEEIYGFISTKELVVKQ